MIDPEAQSPRPRRAWIRINVTSHTVACHTETSETLSQGENIGAKPEGRKFPPYLQKNKSENYIGALFRDHERENGVRCFQRALALSLSLALFFLKTHHLELCIQWIILHKRRWNTFSDKQAPRELVVRWPVLEEMLKYVLQRAVKRHRPENQNCIRKKRVLGLK